VTCIYSTFEGLCTLLWNEEEKISEAENDICLDKNGYCCVEDDEDPSISCNSFESSDYNECPECGEDMETFDVCNYCGYCVNCGYSPCECEFIEEDEEDED
jgi:hypothetical protein